MKIKFQQKKKTPRGRATSEYWALISSGLFPAPIEKQSPLPGNDSWKKKPKKLETVINTSVLLIKQHWKNMAEIPLKRDFLTWSIQNFVRKGKQFDRRYDIT